MVEIYRIFIDGAWHDGAGGTTFPAMNPLNQETWARIASVSEHASATTLAFCRLVEEAGFPRGVVNVVTGDVAIPLKWSVSLADDVGMMVAKARRAVDEFGIKVLCLKAADRRGRRQDIANFETVRRAVGDHIVIGVDPNAGWSVSDAISAVYALRPLDLGYIEQPTARRDLRGMAAIRRKAAGVPMMADESLFTLQDAHALAEADAVDAFCIKLYKVGGLTGARKIAAVAESANILLNCGGLEVQSQLEAAASAHFYASTPVRRMIRAGEFLFDLNTTAPDPLVPETDFVVRDGHVDVPTGRGLGVTIDEKTRCASTRCATKSSARIVSRRGRFTTTFFSRTRFLLWPEVAAKRRRIQIGWPCQPHRRKAWK